MLPFQNSAFGGAKPDPELFFRDGVRKIDFVLAFEDDKDGAGGGGGRRRSLFGDTGHSLGCDSDTRDIIFSDDRT